MMRSVADAILIADDVDRAGLLERLAKDRATNEADWVNAQPGRAKDGMKARLMALDRAASYIRCHSFDAFLSDTSAAIVAGHHAAAVTGLSRADLGALLNQLP
jgi:hypothetical protein